MTTIPNKIKLADGTEIPVISADKAVDTELSIKLKEVAAAMGKEAIEEAFRHNLPVTIGKDDKIIKLYPDGREEIIGVLPA